MAENLHGDFLLELPEIGDFGCDLEPFDIDEDDILATLDLGIGLFTASTVSNDRKMTDELKVPAMPELPTPETPCVDIPKKRFKQMPTEEIEKMFEARQAPSTKKNTLWGMKIFQDWSIETNGYQMDMETIDAPTLADALTMFYCSARPKPKSTAQAENDTTSLYHRNTLINIRGAINRHLADLKRNIDIVRDVQFKTSNGVLDGLLKERTRLGQSEPTRYKAIIEPEDLKKISAYLDLSSSNPIILRQSVWYSLSVHFVSRGLEFHHQLHLNSFEFHEDDTGEYVTLKHETQQKNHQGGMTSAPSSIDKRMYADPEMTCCPVKMLKLLIKKTDPQATHLFNQYSKSSTILPLSTDIWYTPKPLGKRSFEKMLPNICKAAGVERKYTPHCLRATAVEHLDHAGFQARHIMFMSDHRNESSLRPYNRSVSSKQKQALSHSLSAICRPTESSRPPQTITFPAASATVSVSSDSNSEDRSVIPAFTMQSTSNNIMSTPGFFTSSTFNNCNFSFNQ